MSGRVGRIEKAIVALLTRFPDLSFSVDDLCIAAYPGVVIGTAQRDTVMGVMRKRANTPTSELVKLRQLHAEVRTGTDVMDQTIVNDAKALHGALNRTAFTQWQEEEREDAAVHPDEYGDDADC